MLIATALFIFFLLPQSSFGQFSGTVAAGATGATNIEGVDTTSPDLIFQPAITLEYQTEFSPLQIYKLSFEHAPQIYTVTPAHTYTETTFGLQATFYLSNLDAITSEWTTSHEEEKTVEIPPPPFKTQSSNDSSKASVPISKDSAYHIQAGLTSQSNPSPNTIKSILTPEAVQVISDSLIELVSETLSDASEALDSIEFKGKNADIEGDLRDSVSESISALSNVLDSVAFSSSVKSVALDIINSAKAVLTQITIGQSYSKRVSLAFDNSILWMSRALPEDDFLATRTSITTSIKPTITKPSPTRSDTSKTIQAEVKQPIETSGRIPAPIKRTSKTLQVEIIENEANAPVYTLLNATEEFRNDTWEDFDIVENITPMSATTYAFNLQTPFSYELDRNRPGFNIYNFNQLTLEGTLEGFASKSVVFDLTYDYVNSQYGNDSIFTNSENRVRLGVRGLLSTTTTLFGEAIAGLKNYATTIDYLDTTIIGKVKRIRSVPLPTSFQLYIFGLGIVHHAGDDANFGGLIDISTSPNLRVFLDQLPNRARQQASGITDDDYTYTMQRVMLFSTVRVLQAVDWGLSIVGELRKYGSVLAKDKAALINSTGADRNEKDFFLNSSLTHTFTFDEKTALSIFDLITIEAALAYSGVRSTAPSGRPLPQYTYRDTEGTFTITLGF
jgi:hypothetical protein